ncbi:MAG: SPASM domain-containing protein [Candidatus Bathyarchaeota archaeon]|nr:SPASM domain-containing protein [Candidatus Bathyarchaeum tardum]WGM89362.1 MAG: SPASM domain-containing protein [Candidatus Bathyarchaeum tardum]WNZ28364.1 MAG: SPASM domain-containing protein [Candidatus Bathyarchaeota archaeon]
MLKTEPWLEITTISKCSIDCRYCPQQTFQEQYQGAKILTLENFKKALSKVPRKVAIHFSGFSEPFLNPQCLDMIEHASLKGHKIVLFSTLVGLKSENVERIRRCNPEVILHLPDNMGNTNIPVTENYKKTLDTVLKNLNVTGYYVMDKNFISNERAGHCDDTPKRHVRGWFFCEKLIGPQFVMLPNCDVVLCCMDYELKHLVGNLLKQTWNEIVNSEEYQTVRANRYKFDGEILCRKCVWASLTFRSKYYLKRILQKYYEKQSIQQYKSKKMKN